jgi:hypothetical protein
MVLWANSSRPYLKKKKSQKRAGGVAQGIGPDFKSQYHQKQNIDFRISTLTLF